jgi:hypothetical protein
VGKTWSKLGARFTTSSEIPWPAVAAIAGSAIDLAAGDGKLETSELGTISAALEQRFGQEDGRRALLRAFPRQLDKLDSGAAASCWRRPARSNCTWRA